MACGCVVVLEEGGDLVSDTRKARTWIGRLVRPLRTEAAGWKGVKDFRWATCFDPSFGVTSSPLSNWNSELLPAEIAGSIHGSAEIIPFELPQGQDMPSWSSDEVANIMRCVDVKLRTPCVLKLENFNGQQGCKVVKVAQLVTNSWHDAN